MKSSILPLALLVIVFSSCTTAYKSGQTPDDVYFSPARPQEEYVRNETRKEEQNFRHDDYNDDHYLRMKVRNRYRWSDIEDPYYYRRTYAYDNYSCCNCKNGWTPYAYWNYYYNPYYRVVNPRATVYTAPRKVNLAAYNNPNNPTVNTKTYTTPRNYSGSGRTNNTYTAPRTTNSSNNDDGNSGNILRSIINSGSNKSSSSGTNNNSGSSSGSTSNSNSSSSNSGNSAPVRKF